MRLSFVMSVLLRINLCFQKSKSRFCLLDREIIHHHTSSSTIKNSTSRRLILDMTSNIHPPAPNRDVEGKVVLKPGFHFADWVRLTEVSDHNDLSGLNGSPMRKISLQELSEHNSQYNNWIAYKGNVYNISKYLPYHPGGEEILKKSAGKDCTKLFDKYHPWVDCDQILRKCQVGFLQDEGSSSDNKEAVLGDKVVIPACSELKH
jgi:cytochrome b involved in lipid metabolism